MSIAEGVISGNGDERRCLVVVFLRGGADGLSLVAPLEDDAYYNARPRIALSRQEALPLDGFFGLNPKLAGLKPVFDEGRMAVIHGAGSEDETRSHFEAQDLMEHGGIVAGGWLGRFLRFRENPSGNALAAIAIGRSLPESLRGAPAATVLESLDDFALGENAVEVSQQLARLYQNESSQLGESARNTLDALRRIDELRGQIYQPANSAVYPDSEFGQGLMQIARLIKARVGLEAATIDLGGWDSHLAQGTLITPLMTELGDGLGAFCRDMGNALDSTSVVVMTEFGRRVRENTAFGTDHGRGSVMLTMGGGVRGGRVIGGWAGLNDEFLVGPGDVPMTHNYRDVLAPILERHGASNRLDAVFPGYALNPMEIYGIT